MTDLKIKAGAPGGSGLGRHSSVLGALIRKQFMELSTLYSFGKNRSKKGSTGGAVITLILYIFLAVSIGSSMLIMAHSLGEELLGKGEDWKYFLLLDITGVALAMLITMFSADLTLFRAKDNEMLLSMPIPPGYILLARMIPLYFIALIFTASSVIPAIVVYKAMAGMSLGLVLLNVLMLFSLGLLALGLSSVLGWFVSLLSSRLKGKSIVSTIVSLVFLGTYFFIYFQFSKFSQALLERSSAMADTIHKVFPPLYFIGKAHTGDPLGIVLGLLTIAVIFGIIYFVLSRSFRSVVISSSKASSSKVGSGVLKAMSQPQALLHKEIRRFLSSSSYMMNCGLGSFFMVIAAVAAVIKREALLGFLDAANGVFPEVNNYLPGILTVLIFGLVSTCYYTMPSISLEGKSIWILQSLPVDPMKVFISKIKMEYVLCGPGILILATVSVIVLKMSVISWAAVILASIAYTTFTAFFGLWINLLRPNLEWTNEAYPIKQGLNPLICLFGEWLLTLALGGILFFVGFLIPVEAYLLVVSLILFVVSYIIYRWLLTGGRARFAAL